MPTALVDPYGRPARSGTTYTASELAAQLSREGRSALTGYSVAAPMRQSAWVYSAILQIASQGAQVPIGLWTDTARYKQIMRHEVLTLMRAPNSRQSEFSFKETILTHLMHGGNVFLYKDGFDPREPGLPRALLPFGREWVTPVRTDIYSPVKKWMIRGINGKEVEVDESQLIHIKLPNPYDPYGYGLAPTDSLVLTLAGDRAKQIYDEAFFRHNANPSAVLSYKAGELDEEQKDQVKQLWDQVHQGPASAGHLAVIGGDWDFKIWGATHDHTQFIDVRKLSREEISAAFFGFPVTLLNSQVGGLSTTEHEAARLVLMENCVLPNLLRISSELNRHLVQPFDPKVVLEFNTDLVPILITSQLKTKMGIFAEGVRAGTPPNIMIKLLDLPMDPILGGDSGYLTSNFVPLEMLGGTTPAADGGGAVVPKEAGVRMPPPQVLSEAEPVIRRAASKLKAALWGIRKDSFRWPERFVDGAPVPIRREWAKATLPVVVGAYQLGYEQVCRDKFGGADTWVSQCDDPEAELVALQQSTKQLSFRSERMERECEAQAAKMVKLLSGVAMEAGEVGLRDPEGVPKAMSGMDRGARKLAEQLVRSAVNAGRYEAIIEHGQRPVLRRLSCQFAHADARYPGGGKDFATCDCLVDAAGGVDAESGGQRCLEKNAAYLRLTTT